MLLFLVYEGDLISEIDFDSSEELLNEEVGLLTVELGVDPLESFLSADDEEYEDIETEWFSAKEGLKTIDALVNELSQNESELGEWVLDDLLALQAALKILQNNGRKFYLTME